MLRFAVTDPLFAGATPGYAVFPDQEIRSTPGPCRTREMQECVRGGSRLLSFCSDFQSPQSGDRMLRRRFREAHRRTHLMDTVFNLFAEGSPRAVSAPQSLTGLNIVILLAISCAVTNIRLGSLQLQDFLLLFLLWFCITSYAYSGFTLPVPPVIRPLFRSYGLFMLSLVILALLAVRLTFFPLDQASFLKQPILFSISKVLQFGAVLCGFLWLTNAFVKHNNLL